MSAAETPSSGGTAPRTIDTAINDAPWSLYQKAILGCLALVFAVDGLANQSLGIALPSIIQDWGLERSAFAPVHAANLAGVAFGSVLGGLIGDRIGRRWALISAIFLFGIMTSLGAVTQDPTQLMLVRFVDGLGIGAAIPNGAAMIAEFTPERRRGRAIAIGMVFIPIGGITAGAMGASLLEHVGWRPLLLIAGLVPLILGTIFAAMLPESPAFLLRGGKEAGLKRLLEKCRIPHSADETFLVPPVQESVAAPVRTLVAPEFRARTLLIWAGFFTCLMSSYTLFSWVPTMLHTLGFDLTTTSYGIMTFHSGSVVGALISGFLLDRYGFRMTHVGYAAMGTVMAVALAAMLGLGVLSVLIILPAMMALGFCLAGLHNTLYTLAASIYPTEVRATGVGTASATGRIGAVLSSFTGVMSLDLGGSVGFFGVVAALIALCGLAGWAVRSQTASKPLETHP